MPAEFVTVNADSPRSMAIAEQMPAWFGKLPGMGDFAQRRMDERFMAVWDGWLQRGLLQLRSAHEDWLVHYLKGPVCFFALGAGVAGALPWLGVLVPSVDSVGRYFPLTLVAKLAPPSGVLHDADRAGMRCWWGAGGQAALSAIENDMNGAGFEEVLHTLFSNNPHTPSLLAPNISLLPEAGQSCWFTQSESAEFDQLVVTGLPDGGAFNALFGLAERVPLQGTNP